MRVEDHPAVKALQAAALAVVSDGEAAWVRRRGLLAAPEAERDELLALHDARWRARVEQFIHASARALADLEARPAGCGRGAVRRFARRFAHDAATVAVALREDHGRLLEETLVLARPEHA